MRMIAIGLLAGLVTGCSTTPVPTMSPGEYHVVSRHWVGWDRCISEGRVSANIGALGVRQMKAELGTRQYDQSLLDAEVQQASKEIPTVDGPYCNKMATVFMEREQQSEINRAAAIRHQQDTQNTLKGITKPVFCNTVGGVTMCN